jgi:Zn-dependent protease with chaperone function
VIVALVMLLLPLIYFALIGGIGYGLYYHITENITLIQRHIGRGNFLLYTAPIIIGFALLVFMFKPIFVTLSDYKLKPIRLNPKKEPLLFDFVERLCAKINAPMPSSIEVDYQINASARLSGGFLGNKLALTIGLPLVAGLTLREFAGVLAHEFGHFSQSVAMRLSYLIRMISYLIARLVYERDAYDDMIERATKGTRHGIILLLLGMIRLTIFLTRKILWVLMIIGNMVSSFLLRQMEYNADSYEIQIGGSKSFESTTTKLAKLNASYQSVRYDLTDSWDEGRLPNNLPIMIAAYAEKLPPEAHKYLKKNLLAAKTGIFDTHPSDRDRIAKAKQENRPGLFHLELPASAIFHDFEQISQEVTFDYYKSVLGDNVDNKHLIDTRILLGKQDEMKTGQDALTDFFGKTLAAVHPILIAPNHLNRKKTIETLLNEFNEAKAFMKQTETNVVKALRLNNHWDKKMIVAFQAEVLLEATLKINPKDFNLKDGTQATADAAYLNAIKEINQTLETIRPYFDKAAVRIASALALWSQEAVAVETENGQAWKQNLHERFIPSLFSLATNFEQVYKLSKKFTAFSTLLYNLNDNQQNAKLQEAIKKNMETLCAMLETLRASLDNVAYPFEHAHERLSLAEYLIPHGMPACDDAMELHSLCAQLFDKFYGLYFRVLGSVVYMANQIEKAIDETMCH